MVDDSVAFPSLGDADLALLEGLGTRRTVEAGEYLFREGDQTYNFYAVLSGVVEIVSEADGSDHVIIRHGAGRFIGELGLLTGQRVFLSARVIEPGEVVVLSRE